jgi:hypothetical protein
VAYHLTRLPLLLGINGMNAEATSGNKTIAVSQGKCSAMISIGRNTYFIISSILLNFVTFFKSIFIWGNDRGIHRK